MKSHKLSLTKQQRFTHPPGHRGVLGSSARDSGRRPSLNNLGAAERGAIYPTQEVAILTPQKNSLPCSFRGQKGCFWEELHLINTMP